MSQEPTPSDRQLPLRVYTEEEQQRRWVLIIEAILSDPGPDGRQERWLIAPPPVLQPTQTV
jgi:hypothetical protein